MIAWAVLIALVVALTVPFVLAVRQSSVDAADRAAAAGQFATLTQGATWLRWHGPARGPVIVAVHGLTTPSRVFDPLAERLGRMGYRVLTYDLYGRGLSDRAAGRQDAAFFLRQLDDVLTDQRVGPDVILMGYSMGGAIVAAFTAAQPHRVGRVILLAPAGMVVTEGRFWSVALRVPILGDWLVATFGARQLAAEAAPADTPVGQIQRAELTRRGGLTAVLSSRRHMLHVSQEQAHRTLGRQDIPVLAVWGGQDRTIPLQALGMLAQWNRNTMQEVVPDADHALPWRHADEVAEIIRTAI
ncbi:Lysophospholipase, alpha-beta hydrolase superfamily [Loktanella fryxellensis]|uniref:Lysophospholipase, alpha-beta hydrolase superfamily n=1 Tax=Loktanella fryxellensis TaxID=245187 RepID=A0A1H8FNV4_9RHOB|nr:alpha/beta hydrolase [Loktanella fryxellensis]SEN33376.1 Lysophospholipase, alpha-beta hydrolase superfamily [Loktanella fryxellensis]